jgi:hypothetical protein
MVHLSEKTGAVFPTLWSACVSWIVLMGGLIAFLRAGGRGRTGWELPASSSSPTLICCVAPGWLVQRRLGHVALETPTLISLVAVSLSLRLVFEDNLFSYYFVALAVVLVVDVVHGHIRQTAVTWLAMLSLVYCEPTIFV